MSGVSISFDGLSTEEARYLLEALDHIRGGAVQSTDMDNWATAPQRTEAAYATIPAADHLGSVPLSYQPDHTAAPAPQAAQPAVDESASADSTGMSWNGAIHSSSKKLAADGSWALRRGYPKAEGDAYKAEFKRRKQLGDTLHATHAAPPVQGGGDQFGHLAMNGVSAAAPSAAQLNQHFQAPPVQQSPAAPAPSYAAPAIDYATWHGLYGRMHAAGKIDEGVYNWMNQQAGVTDINEYFNNATARQLSYGVLQQLELA